VSRSRPSEASAKRKLPVASPTRWSPELLEAIAAGERRVLMAILTAGGEGAPEEAARVAFERAEDLARNELGRDPPPLPIACKKGCSACCVSKVLVTAPEAIRLAAHLRRTLDEAALARVVDRVRAADAKTRGLSREKRLTARVPCPLLAEDGSCSVHAVRPLLCAGWTSLDAAACDRYFADPSGQPSAPAYAIGYELTSAVLAGLAGACADAGLDGSLLELVAALRIALDRPGAAERWAARLPVFAMARDAG
jgi:Putative zinc- or iron-chelating domain